MWERAPVTLDAVRRGRLRAVDRVCQRGESDAGAGDLSFPRVRDACALGAARGRLIRQLLTESLVLAAAGGTFGLLLARLGLTAIASRIALNGTDFAGRQILPRAGEIRMDGLALGFMLAISVATGVLFGLFPSLRASRPDLAEALRESGAGASGGSSGRAGLLGVSARGLLVISQVALSIILVIGAALMIDSFAHLRNVDPGFKPADLLTVKIALPPLRYDSDQMKIAFFEELAESVRAAQGVRDAAVAMSLPTTGGAEVNVQVEGQPPMNPREQPSAQLQSVTPDYFATLGIASPRARVSAHDNVRERRRWSSSMKASHAASGRTIRAG